MFKKSSKKKGAIRKRKLSEGEEQNEDEVDQEEVEKLKLAKLKRELLTKKAGVSAVALAKGKKISKKAELTDDPFKLKSGTVLTILFLSWRSDYTCISSYFYDMIGQKRAKNRTILGVSRLNVYITAINIFVIIQPRKSCIS